jgi:hypothetical protein
MYKTATRNMQLRAQYETRRYQRPVRHKNNGRQRAKVAEILSGRYIARGLLKKRSEYPRTMAPVRAGCARGRKQALYGSACTPASQDDLH